MSYNPVRPRPNLVQDQPTYPVQPRIHGRGWGVEGFTTFAGMVYSFHGESESGKSLVVQAECARLLNGGEYVLYVDVESDAKSVVDRLRQLGAGPRAIEGHFDYRQPELKPSATVEELAAWTGVLSGTYALAVIDGGTDALGIFGYSTKDNDDPCSWIKEVPRLIATRTGAAVVLVDHVVKDTGTRGRWAIGGQQKMAGLTGAAYTVEVVEPLGRGIRGEVVLRVAKDRPGSVRRPFRKGDRTRGAARIVVDSTDESTVVTVGPWTGQGGDDPDAPATFRPTHLMRRVSETLERQPRELTKSKVATVVGGKKKATPEAVDLLEDEKYVAKSPGRNGYPVYESVKPYREKDDPLSDRYMNVGNHSHAK